MPKKPPVTLAKINIVAKDFERTLAFYRLVGLDIPDVRAEPPEYRHVTANNGDGSFAIDNEALARIYSAEWRGDGVKCSALITAQLASRAEVDEIYDRLVAAGHKPIQRPWDAFWGARYAIVSDPDGNSVGLESPRDGERTWPPIASPDL